MAVKFIGLRHGALGKFDFTDKKRWAPASGDGRSFKLLNPDYKQDICFAAAEMKATKAYDATDRLYISGIANANVVDRMQERLDPRGIQLDYYMRNAQLLAHHSYYHPIGQVEQLDVQEDGVHFSGWIGDPKRAELTEMQKEMRSLVAQGILKTVSVGFIPKKIRAPLYNAEGILEEPCVIEAWELLELSVVAVPANQDSVFGIRGQENTETVDLRELCAAGIKHGLKRASEQNLVVHSLVFDKANFTKPAIASALAHFEFEFDEIEENEKSYFVTDGYYPLDKLESLRTLETSIGVTIVAGKIKETAGATTEDVKAEPPTDTQPATTQEEVVTLLRGIYELSKKTYEMCDNITKKMDEKPSEDEGGEKPEPPVPAEDPEKSVSTRIEQLEKNLNKLVRLIQEKLGK